MKWPLLDSATRSATPAPHSSFTQHKGLTIRVSPLRWDCRLFTVEVPLITNASNGFEATPWKERRATITRPQRRLWRRSARRQAICWRNAEGRSPMNKILVGGYGENYTQID